MYVRDVKEQRENYRQVYLRFVEELERYPDSRDVDSLLAEDVYGRQTHVLLANIGMVRLDKRKVWCFTLDGLRYLTRRPLADIKLMLEKHNFFWVNQWLSVAHWAVD